MAEKADYHWDARKKEWSISQEFELRTNRKMKEKAIARLLKEIAEIDRALDGLSGKRHDA